MRPHARTLQTGGELVVLTIVESRYINDLAVVETQLLVVLTHGRNHGVHRVHNFPPLHGTDLLTSFEGRPGDATIDAKRLSQVIPGFRGIPAGISTMGL